jgi:hypothetical protein
MVILRILLIIACVFAALFILSLVMYFFNLDMRLAAKLIPVMNRHYDKIKRERFS